MGVMLLAVGETAWDSSYKKPETLSRSVAGFESHTQSLHLGRVHLLLAAAPWKAEACQSVCATPAARPTHSGLALICGHRVFVYSNLALSGAYAPGTIFPNSAIKKVTGEVLVLYGDMELYLQRCCVPNRAEILSD
jgi:hypothetical protein